MEKEVDDSSAASVAAAAEMEEVEAADKAAKANAKAISNFRILFWG